MTTRSAFYEDSYYHIYNRGLNKQTLFYTKTDYKRFLKYIRLYLDRFADLQLITLCLLPNHFHLIIKNKNKGLEISQLMCLIEGSYAKYFIAKYKNEKGKKIFESRFKAKLLFDKDYLYTCINYIMNNAQKHKIVDRKTRRDYCINYYKDYYLLDKNKKIDLTFLEY